MSIKISDLAKKLNLDVKDLRKKIQGLHLGVSERANVFRDDLGIEIEKRLSVGAKTEKPDNLFTEKKKTEPVAAKSFDEPKAVPVVKSDEPKKEEKTEVKAVSEENSDELKKEKVDEVISDDSSEAVSDDSDEPQEELQKAYIFDSISVGEFANEMSVGVSDVIKELMKNGVLANINERIDFETAVIIGEDFGFEVLKKEETENDFESDLASLDKYTKDSLKSRPPIVTVMGHVDHGKTSILDQIRQAEVVASESGGITQHMGAYQTKKNDKKITFLDTPGHKAFSAMRAHGAKLTDIAVLVVAADDGVKPQTVEAINHAKAAGVPIVIALNKIDRAEANIDKVKKELADYNLIPEEWGGKTIMVNTSAKTGEGIDDLLEMILLVAEVEDLKAHFDGPAQGVVIEAHLSKRVGPVATVMVTQGCLTVRDNIVVGLTDGVVRAMIDYTGERITKACPSDPVRVAGLNEVPEFGDVLYAVESSKKAKAISSERKRNLTSRGLRAKSIGMAELSQAVREGKINELPIILKSDVQGSLEAIKSSLENVQNEEVRVNILHEAVGAVNESDVMMAASSNALILAFGSKIEPNAMKMAKKMAVNISSYDIIYRLLEDVKAALEGLLEPEEVRTKIGKAKILKIFTRGKKFRIVGVNVTKGRIDKGADVVAFRAGENMGEGKVENLKKGTDSTDTVPEKAECGVGLSGNLKLEEGDSLEFWVTETQMRKL